MIDCLKKEPKLSRKSSGAKRCSGVDVYSCTNWKGSRFKVIPEGRFVLQFGDGMSNVTHKKH